MATHLVVTGKVQGVGYRASFEAQASALGLSGWVRNRRDGSVEAIVAGDPAAVDRILEWARRGPPFARVETVAVNEVDSTDDFGGSFTIRPTE